MQKVGLEQINTVERDAYGNDNSIKYHVYADGLIVMEADRSGKVHYEVVPAIPEEIRDGAITSPVDRAFEGVIDGTGKVLGDTIDVLVSLYKFSEKNLQPGNINYIEKAIFAYQLIHDPKKKLGEMKDKVINFPKYMWEGMKNAWNRDVINGDAHSRAEFFSYGLTTIGIGVIGDKGLSRAGQLGNAAKLGHVGKIGNVANKIPPPIPITKGLTPAFATGTVNTIPYNVMDDLYNRIHQASKEAFGDSRGGKVSVGVGGFKTFKTNELLDQHYKKHGNELKNAFNKYNYSIENYLNDANHVIQKGTYVPELNGYVKLVGGKGSAKYAFVGLDRTTEEITTFHLKSVSELMKKAPSLKLMK